MTDEKQTKPAVPAKLELKQVDVSTFLKMLEKTEEKKKE